jgi:hypothetical protein
MFRHITMGVISGAGDADIPNLYVACSFCSIFLLQSPLTRIICNRFILLDLFCSHRYMTKHALHGNRNTSIINYV